MRLPESLLEEIKARNESRKSNSRRSHEHQVSRKEARKQDRLERKKRKAEFHGLKKCLTVEELESPQRKKARQTDPSTDRQHSHKLRTVATISGTSTKKKTVHGRVKLAWPDVVPKAKSRVEEEEEAYIAYLEAKLGYTGKGNKGKSDADDGLADLLYFADSVAAGEPSARLVASRPNEKAEDDGDDTVDKSEEESGESDILDESEGRKEDSESNGEEWTSIGDSICGQAEGSNSVTQPTIELAKVTAGTTPYIPPHSRIAQKPHEQSSEVDTRLIKQLKGLLNRMSERNLPTILNGIEEVYRTYRRHDVASTLTKLIIDSITNHSSLLDSFVVLHAALVSSLHRVIGVEFVALFVQCVISDYETHYASVRARNTGAGDEAVGKECLNLIVLLSELYNFQVVASVLVYDVIRGLLQDTLTEFGVELLLKLLRNSGQQLRQDDPSALKDIVTIVQSKVSGREGGLSSRTRFMLETLMNLKNNKSKRSASQNQGGEAVERIKKFLAGLGKKSHLHGQDALRVSLEDLRSAETKGKWWLVGAAWDGDPLVDRQMEQPADAPVKDNAGDRLLKLARKQGMNTDIRRSTFVVIMSSDDYVDACERLSQLNLTAIQQREIVRVLLHCCGNEKTYNPYYTLICQHLCQTAHAHKITLQYYLWDFLRDLGESNVGGAEVMTSTRDDDDRFGIKAPSKVLLRNVAKAYGWWIAKDSVTLTILKPVDFTILKSQGREFLRELIINVFLSSQAASPAVGPNAKRLPTTRNRAAVEEIFIKATRAESLAMGLAYFVTEVFHNFSGEDEELTKLIKWASGVAKDTLQTGLDIVPVL
ncbi:hypothetical protein AX15_001975 [Amanita polypyramis BW_CC]|nr:hypothetical protein AX15_001975 [Amanita polypyramis BW_CC]